MVIAHHLLWTLYGWWLPNDPRGSTSRVVRRDCLTELGDLHLGRKRVQPTSAEIREFHQQAAKRLTHPLMAFRPDQFPEVADAFALALGRFSYTCYALALMPDHVHLIVRKHRDPAEVMIDKLQQATRAMLTEKGLRPADHPIWTRGGWRKFLNTPDDMTRTIRYIENNPLPLGLPRQQWECVTRYDGWPFHKATQPQAGV